MKPTWIVDKSVVFKLSQHNEKIHEVIQRLGYQCILTEIDILGNTIVPNILDNDGPYIFYGSHRFVRLMLKEYPKLRYAAYGVNDRTVASSYLSNLPVEWFLNDQAIFMPWKLFKHQGKDRFSSYKTGLFIRPNSGFKTFAGQTIMFDKWNYTIELLEDVTSVTDETMILISPLKDIIGEFRFVVCDGQVVTGSEYRWDDRLDIRIDYPIECFDLAEKIANHDWQVDDAYIVDVASTIEGPKVIELNSFSCAGLYACDLEKIVKSLSSVSLKTWKEMNL